MVPFGASCSIMGLHCPFVVLVLQLLKVGRKIISRHKLKDKKLICKNPIYNRKLTIKRHTLGTLASLALALGLALPLSWAPIMSLIDSLSIDRS